MLRFSRRSGSSDPWRSAVRLVLAVLLLVMGGSVASAADDAVDERGTPPLLQFDAGSAIVNIAIFIGVFIILSKLVWPVVLRGLEMRDMKIRDDLRDAFQANEDAKALLSQYQAQLAEASNQVQKMLADAQKNSDAERQRIVADARVEADNQRLRVLAEIEQAKKVAISELANQTSDMALAVACRIVGRELQPADHADLIRQSLDRLPSNN